MNAVVSDNSQTKGDGKIYEVVRRTLYRRWEQVNGVA